MNKLLKVGVGIEMCFNTILVNVFLREQHLGEQIYAPIKMVQKTKGMTLCPDRHPSSNTRQ